MVNLSLAVLGLTSLTATHPISDHEHIHGTCFTLMSTYLQSVTSLNQTNAYHNALKPYHFYCYFIPYIMPYMLHNAYINKLSCTVCEFELRQTVATMRKFTCDGLIYYICIKTYHTPEKFQ